MKNLIKKYYEMDDEVKKDLELLYTYQVLLSLFGEYENIKIKTIGELEKLMQIIQKCMISTNFSVDCIITNILEILNYQDITINDLDDLELEDLLEVLFTDEEYEENDEDCQDEETSNDKNNQEIIAEFTYKDYYCIFCQNRDKYLIILNKGKDTDVVVLNSIDEIFNGTLERKLSELN